jgi:hypothetical protein
MGTTIRRRSIVAAWVIGLAVVASAREASAYPQFQFSSGTTRCGQCHYSPSGGGLITSWGRDESADTISLGGNGGFMHGAVTPPSWLALGLDFRYAGIFNDVGGASSPEVVFFPMQLDAYVHASYDAVSFNATLGARGVVRPLDPSVSGRTSDLANRVISPEHYLMWRPSATGPYVRAGRFAAPYGLRFVEHIYFVRRYTGFDLYEETYNLSGGFVTDEWEVHATAFMHVPRSFPDIVGPSGQPENGGAVYGERRFSNMAAVALQSRVGIAGEEARYQWGAVGKLWIDQAQLLFLGEADFIRQQLTGAHVGQNQLVSYLGATYFMRGLMAGVAYERFQEDLAVASTGRNAIDGEVNFFPWAHFEVLLLGRYQWESVASNGRSGTGAWLGMLQLHYYL